MGYRISTAVFALLFLFMVARDVFRPEPERAPEGWPSPVGSDEPGAGPDTKTDPVGPKEDPPAVPDQPAVVEPPLDFATRLLFPGPGTWNDWPGILAQLRPRRRELVPLLEDWLRRREELMAAGIELYTVPYAYADLAGEKALPLLIEIIDGGGVLAGGAAYSLTRIDSAEAAATLVRCQEALTGRSTFVNLDHLWQGTPPFRAVVRQWAERPPPGHERLRKTARKLLFLGGTSAEREALWPEFDLHLRLWRLEGSTARSWGGVWPERYRKMLNEALWAANPDHRFRAASMISSDGQHLEEELISAAERVVEQGLASAGGEHPSSDSWAVVQQRLAKMRKDREAEQRRRKLLTPR